MEYIKPELNIISLFFDTGIANGLGFGDPWGDPWDPWEEIS